MPRERLEEVGRLQVPDIYIYIVYINTDARTVPRERFEEMSKYICMYMHIYYTMY